jgi:hypothetical protein
VIWRARMEGGRVWYIPKRLALSACLCFEQQR